MAEPIDRRRSARQEVKIEVVLRSTDEAGRDFFDRSEVISVDRNGARLRTRFQLKIGSEFELQLPGENETKRMRVVWRGDVGSFEAGVVGAEFVNPIESWDDKTLQTR
jgi:hypothetical protein